MKEHRDRLLLFLALLLAAIQIGCGNEAPPPNIVLVSIDSLRADHLGAYGYERPTSPNIDRIAADGILFERAYSVTSWTLPAHLTMLTGLYPEEHGVVSDDRSLSDRAPLLPELLAERGYRSAAVVSCAYLHSNFGYGRGWETYDDQLALADDIPQRSIETASLVTSPLVHARAMRLLDDLREGPFFLFLHYFNVHYDYVPPPAWATLFDSDYDGPIDGRVFSTGLLSRESLPQRDLERLISLYDGEIAWVDHWIGELDRELARRRLDRSTLLVITSDHGEEFFEHGRLGHRRNLFDTTLRIPLIVRLPDRRFGGARVDSSASLVDLAPTLTLAAGAERPALSRSRNLLPVRFGRLSRPLSRDLFASLHGYGAALVRGHQKLITRLDAAGHPDPLQPFFADLAADPDESRNLALHDPLRTARFFVHLRDATREFRAVRARHPPTAFVTPAGLANDLRALGYL